MFTEMMRAVATNNIKLHSEVLIEMLCNGRIDQNFVLKIQKRKTAITSNLYAISIK